MEHVDKLMTVAGKEVLVRLAPVEEGWCIDRIAVDGIPSVTPRDAFYPSQEEALKDAERKVLQLMH